VTTVKPEKNCRLPCVKKAALLLLPSLSVLLEFQADCFAGVWAHYADKYRSLLEPGDVDEGLRAAAAIGDDHLLKRAGKRISPESFTHGSSEQRIFWLRKGLENGNIATCDTFSAAAKK